MNAELVLEKLKRIGYRLKTDGRDILLSAENEPLPARATPLLAELRRCKEEAVRLLQNRGIDAWQAEEQTLIERFLISPVREAPFHLNPHTHVLNSELFYAALRREIEAGPRGARARYGALQDDLRSLQSDLQ